MDASAEDLGPATIWTPLTEQGRQLLHHSVGAWEVKPDGTVTVESRRNAGLKQAFREAGLTVEEI